MSVENWSMNMGYPSEWEATFTLADGKKIDLRPKQSTDTEMLWNMFSTLSEKSLSNLVPPFTRERIEGWTSDIDHDKVLTIVAVVREKDEQRIVGSASLSFNKNEIFKHKAELAIAVHDDYQNMAIGTLMLKHLLDIAKIKGLRKVWLLVNTDNDRAVHLYKKVGFEIEGKLSKERYSESRFGDEYRMAVFF
jgi:ribosomal protein S18 acetylase RimI-like enzyme